MTLHCRLANTNDIMAAVVVAVDIESVEGPELRSVFGLRHLQHVQHPS